MMEWLSDALLYVAFVATTALLLLYGLLQPWWRSWFGIAMVLTLVSLWQVEVRGLLMLWFGDDYAVRDLGLLLGRAGMAAGATIAVIGLGRQLLRTWRATRSVEWDPWTPREHSHKS